MLHQINIYSNILVFHFIVSLFKYKLYELQSCNINNKIDQNFLKILPFSINNHNLGEVKSCFLCNICKFYLSPLHISEYNFKFTLLVSSQVQNSRVRLYSSSWRVLFSSEKNNRMEIFFTYKKINLAVEAELYLADEFNKNQFYRARRGLAKREFSLEYE